MNGSKYRYGRKRRYDAKEKKPPMSFEKRTGIRVLAAGVTFLLLFALAKTELPQLQAAKIYVARALISTTDVQETQERFQQFCTTLGNKYPFLSKYWPVQAQPEAVQAQPEDAEQPEAVPASGENTDAEAGEAPMVQADPSAALGLVAEAAEEPQPPVPPEFVFPETVDITIPLNGEITSPFGGREHPVNQTASDHRGVDIAGNQGTPVVAAAPGKVIKVGYDDVDGNHIVIQHTVRAKTMYAHLDTIAVTEGDIVGRDTQIGTVGATGLVTGPHLHFEIWENDVCIDPERYISLPHRP